MILVLLINTLQISWAQSIPTDENKAPRSFSTAGEFKAAIYAQFHKIYSPKSNDREDVSRRNQGFEITRAYFGYQNTIGKNLLGVVRLDVGRGSASAYTAYLKNAGVQWEINEKMEACFGLIPTTQFNLQEKIWGKRYLYKSFQDENEFGSSADAGVSVKYKFNSQITMDGSVFNGNGYKNIGSGNTRLQYALGTTLSPFEGLSVRVYGDVYSAPMVSRDTLAAKSTLAFFAGYKTNRWAVSAEYNTQKKHSQSLKDLNLHGFSVYGGYRIVPKIDLFIRYDKLNVYKNQQLDGFLGNGNLFITGLEYELYKNNLISINYRRERSGESMESILQGVYINLQAKF